MDSNKLIKTSRSMPSPEYILDRTRICPNCGREHWVNNRARNFCSKKCYDNYYNDHLRNKIETRGQFEFGGKTFELGPESYSIEDKSNDETGQTTQRSKNLLILRSLLVDPNDGTIHRMEDLELSGYSFNVYDSRVPFENQVTGKNCFYTIIGEYKICAITYSTISISINKNKTS